MKKITLLLMTLFIAVFCWQAYAQCLVDNFGLFGTLSPNCTTGAVVSQGGAWTGEYSNVNVIAGNEYQFTSSNASHYLTVSNAAGTSALAFGGTPLTWTSTVTGTVRFYTHLSSACNFSTAGHTRAVRCLAPLQQLTCGDMFYDNGGPGGNYTANAFQRTLVMPNVANGKATVTFNSFNVESSWDGLMIYDGPNTSSPILSSGSTFNRATCPNGAWTGTGPFSAAGQTFTSTHSTGALYFVFTSDGSGQFAGWDASVGCIFPPTIICPLDITVNSSSFPGNPCGAQVFFANATAQASNGTILPVTQTMGPGSGSIFPVGDTTIQFSATDSNGFTSTCQFTVTVVDDIDPIAVCQDLTVELGESGIYTLDASMLNFGFGFTCTYSVGLYDTFGDGWMGSGSVASLNVIVGGETVLEGITLQTGTGPEWFNFPVMPGQSIQMQYFTNGTWASENWFEVKDGPQGSGVTIYSTTVNQTPAANHTVTNSCESGVGSSDACGSVSFAFNPEGTMTSMTLDCSNLGENMITMYVIDEGGNAVACNVIVTVEDNIAPVIVCLGGGVPDFTPVTCTGNPGPTSAVDANLVSFSLTGEGGTQINFLNNCPGVTGLQNQTALSVDLLPGQTYTVNANSWTCGDFQYAAQTYVWIDFNGDGLLTANEVVLTGAQIFVSQGGPTGTAPTGGNAFSDTFTVPANAYQGPVTIRVMTQETGVTPLLPCATYSWGTMVDFTANILNPDPVGVPQYFLDANGQVEIPITDLYESVSDNAGACGVTVSVGGVGVGACLISTPSNNFESAVGFGANSNPLTQIIANDFIVDANTDFILESIKINVLMSTGNTVNNMTVFVYEDNGGLPGTLKATQLGVVPISQPQVATGFGGIFREVTMNIDPVLLEGQVSGATKYWLGLSFFGVNNNQLSWEATSIINGSPFSFSPNSGATFSLFPTLDGAFTVNGICAPIGGSGGGIVYTCANLGFTNVTVTATDASGKSSSCTSMIEIIDNIPPVLVTQDIVVELGPNGTATVTYQDFYAFDDDGVSLSFDNCGIVTGGVNITTFTCADIGAPITVSIFVADSSNNTTVSSATVTVVDLLAPVIGCPAATVTVDADENNDYMIPDWIGDGTISITDNCTDPVVIFEQSPAPGTVVGPGTYTINVTAEDEYGNASSCSFNLVVEEFLSSEDNLLASSVVMYPNPANEFVYLRNNNAQIALTEAIIYDVTGKVITRVDLSQMGIEQRIDISGIATGVYMVTIKSADATTVKRLIKK